MLGICWIRSDAYRFDRFTKELFITEMKKDTLSMHYTLADPQAWDIDDSTVTLPIYSKDAQEHSLHTLKENISFLQTIDCSSLPNSDQSTYTILLDYLETEYHGQLFSYYYEPLSPSSGIQSQLPILFAEYTFRCKEDVKNYLTLLSQFPEYLSGIMQYEQEKSAAGLFMPDYSAKKVIEQCDSIMNKKELSDKTHFLIVSFEERLASLTDTHVITEEEKLSYMTENERILITMVQPAYEKLADCITLLMGTSSQCNGLASLPEGKSYYLYLIRKNTGSNKDITELKTLLLQRFDQDYNSLSALYLEHESLIAQLANNSIPDDLTKEDAAAMLNTLQQQIAQEFPSFPCMTEASASSDEDITLPSCHIKTISSNLAPYMSPAFYLTPPIDDISENSIYINPENNLSGISLYTTLAHEGYPGHLYQTVFSHMYQNEQNINPIHHLLYFGGYVEGWALYVEMLSYEYAKEMTDNPHTIALYEIERLNKSMQLALYCLLDIAIHYDNATYEEVSSVMTQFGITDTSVIRDLYEYIAEEPTTYLKYYIGYLEILELKDEAKKLWGDAYTDLQFHTLFLETGPCNFEHIEIPPYGGIYF
ncbi:MAG: DUF885 domain-containing protein [Lachnospiraceae bacterium]|nr:DUF885 domain-containing protein [Lachnospiraceae bacterium]